MAAKREPSLRTGVRRIVLAVAVRPVVHVVRGDIAPCGLIRHPVTGGTWIVIRLLPCIVPQGVLAGEEPVLVAVGRVEKEGCRVRRRISYRAYLLVALHGDPCQRCMSRIDDRRFPCPQEDAVARIFVLFAAVKGIFASPLIE